MKKDSKNIMLEAITYFGNDRKRINHLIKVNTYAKLIAKLEEVSENEYQIIDIASILHDIGIKLAEEKYGSNEGKYQEIEGPAVAETIMKKFGYEIELVNRVKYLIAHHHTYDQIDGIDYQILVEADFIVNLDEENVSQTAVKKVEEKIFKTASGKKLLEKTFY